MPRRQPRCKGVGMNGPRANVPAFYPDVAADRAAPQADWQDRRAHVQVHAQRGMTHGTDRHQRPPLTDSGARRSVWNGNAAESERADWSRGVGLKKAPDVGAPAALIHRVRKRVGVVRQQFRVRRRAIRTIFNEATKRGGCRLEAGSEDTTANNLQRRVVRHGRTPIQEDEPSVDHFTAGFDVRF